jgi:hypothetical protein
MRYFNGSELGWIAVPAIILVGAAYMWVVNRLLTKRVGAATREQESTVRKAA